MTCSLFLSGYLFEALQSGFHPELSCPITIPLIVEDQKTQHVSSGFFQWFKEAFQWFKSLFNKEVKVNPQSPVVTAASAAASRVLNGHAPASDHTENPSHDPTFSHPIRADGRPVRSVEEFGNTTIQAQDTDEDNFSDYQSSLTTLIPDTFDDNDSDYKSSFSTLVGDEGLAVEQSHPPVTKGLTEEVKESVIEDLRCIGNYAMPTARRVKLNEITSDPIYTEKYSKENADLFIDRVIHEVISYYTELKEIQEGYEKELANPHLAEAVRKDFEEMLQKHNAHHPTLDKDIAFFKESIRTMLPPAELIEEAYFSPSNKAFKIVLKKEATGQPKQVNFKGYRCPKVNLSLSCTKLRAYQGSQLFAKKVVEGRVFKTAIVLNKGQMKVKAPLPYIGYKVDVDVRGFSLFNRENSGTSKTEADCSRGLRVYGNFNGATHKYKIEEDPLKRAFNGHIVWEEVVPHNI